MKHERASDELTDTRALASVFQRQLDVSLMAVQAARLIYDATTIWIGGGTLAWEDLTPLDRKQKKDAVIALITGPQTAPESLPQPDGDSRDLNFDGQEQES